MKKVHSSLGENEDGGWEQNAEEGKNPTTGILSRKYLCLRKDP